MKRFTVVQLITIRGKDPVDGSIVDQFGEETVYASDSLDEAEAWIEKQVDPDDYDIVDSSESELDPDVMQDSLGEAFNILSGDFYNDEDYNFVSSDEEDDEEDEDDDEDADDGYRD